MAYHITGNRPSLNTIIISTKTAMANLRKPRLLSICKKTRWLYCVECPQYSTRRRSASNIHSSGMLRKDR